MPACPVCESGEPTESWRYRDYLILQCPDCDLQFSHPMQGAPVEYYQEHYVETIAAHLANDIHPGFRYTVNKIKYVTQYYLSPDQRRAIDVGCGPGYLLSELKQLRFDCLGIDFNPSVVQIAKEHFHVNAKVGQVEDLITLNLHFDLALLIHVLEHVEDPAGLLRSIRQIMNPGGILFIDLPNRDRFVINRSLQSGDLCWGEYPPHHLTFWSMSSLSKTLELAGYSVLECHPRPFGEEGQINIFLTNRLKLPACPPISLLADGLRRVGRMLGLQGETLYAVARRTG